MNYFIAPEDWQPSDRNPFTEDGLYGPEWRCFCVLDDDSENFYTGKIGKGPFSARFGRNVSNLEQRLIDFLRHENANQHKVILSFPEGFNIEEIFEKTIASNSDECLVRKDDPRVVVHATTLENWEMIREDGELKAGSLLPGKENGSEGSSEIEMYYQHEPAEYRNYIMFTDINSTTPEMVLASKALGRFVMDEKAVYTPGVRLYFDNHRIIEDGKGVRDGLHLIKVWQSLPLEKYLKAAISINDIDPGRKKKNWTMRMFVENTNEVFRNLNQDQY